MPDLEETDDSQDDEAPGCPVCHRHTDADAIASQQVVFMGCNAMIEADDQMVEDVFANLSAYDGHIAISLLLLALRDISHMVGIPVQTMVEKYRENLTHAQQQANAEE